MLLQVFNSGIRDNYSRGYYRAEIDDAIYAVDELERAIQREVSLRDGKPHAVWQMLLSILRLRVKQLES